jgi:hypothetical protein
MQRLRMMIRATPSNVSSRYKPTSSSLNKTVRIFSTAVDNSSDNVAVIRPWKIPMIESHGDYREEAPLEAHIGLDSPLYQHQASLPRLPVPTLEQTIDRFLPTALPLAESEEEAVTLQEACQEFLQQAKQHCKNDCLQRRDELGAIHYVMCAHSRIC